MDWHNWNGKYEEEIWRLGEKKIAGSEIKEIIEEEWERKRGNRKKTEREREVDEKGEK